MEVYPRMQEWDPTGKAKFVYTCKLYTEALGMSDDPKMVYLLFIQVARRGGHCCGALAAVWSRHE